MTDKPDLSEVYLETVKNDAFGPINDTNNTQIPLEGRYAVIPNFVGTREYRTQSVMGASPLRLVIMAFDVAIQATAEEDFERATKAVSCLRDALDFDQGGVSLGFFRLYQWCLDCIRTGNYQEARKTLSSIREAWVSVEKRNKELIVQAA
jgi:flagellin-specific chaperone FliS